MKRLMNTRLAAFLLALSFFSLGLASPGPNIVVILVDDLGYGDLSCYGARDLRTPHIDALFSAGMTLPNFYANCPVCSPTRAALLSGRFPDLAGVPGVIRTRARNSWGYLAREVVLLPENLKAAGYHSALIGKWHLGLQSPNTPNERGFDFFHGFLGDMMDDYYNHRRQGHNYMRLNDQVIDPRGHATDLFGQWAEAYLKARKADGKRFFLYLAYNAPHAPIQPPSSWLEKVKRREPDLTERRAKLVALIEHLDHDIGGVVAAMKDLGLYENTLILFTSDNGGQLSAGASCGRLRGGKQDMYEGGIRVPMCAVWPGHIAAGSRSDRVGLTMDFYPTVCAVAGTKIDHEIDGISLLPTLLGQREGQGAGVRDLVWVRREGGMRYQARDYYALRRGDWKLVQNSPFEPYQLFNLRQDPLEQHDLASVEKGRFRELAERLMVHLQRAGRVPWQAR